MPELVFLLLRLGFLALLWLFVYAAIRVIRLDVFGPKVRRARRPQQVGAAQAASEALPRPVREPKPKPSKVAKGGPLTQLVVTEGALAGTTIELGTAPITIGRAPDSTLVVSDDYVSTHHAQLVPRDGRWLLEDLGSTNGTFLGKTKVTDPVALDAGTSVRIGKTVLEAARMTLAWDAEARSDVGLLREINEDAAYAGTRLFAVADGMGGHAAGEVASAAAIAALAPLDADGATGGDAALTAALTEANTTLRQMVTADADLHGMGTTVTAALVDGDRLLLAHIGDSRAYLLHDGELRQITHDHTLVQQLVDEGRILPAEAESHPQRSLITRALDGRDGLKPDLSVHEIVPGDRLLLCSDGLSGVVSHETITEVLRNGTPAEAVERLIELALRAGGPDNITCVVAEARAAAAGELATPSTRTPTTISSAPRPVTAARSDGTGARRVELPRPSRRGLIATLVVLVVLAVVAFGGWRYVQSQYYVGTDGEQVAIHRGVDGSIIGISLHRVQQTYPVKVADLGPLAQKQVRDGINAADLDDARQIADRIVATAATPTTESPTPAPTLTPSPSASPAAPS